VERALPLEGVRIVSVEQYGAGPFATMHLADLGAEVIKIETPATGGDVGRYVPPFQEGEDSLFFQSLNRNKKSLCLDLVSEAGLEVLHDLVASADALFCNLRGDLPARLGLTYDHLKSVNQRIVCCSLSGYGRTGPRAAEPAYDYVVQGLAGWMSVTGEPDGPPTRAGLSLVDWSGGLTAALSLTVGLHAARRDGVGMDCDVSLLDTAVAMLTYPGAWWLNEGYEIQRMPSSAHPSLVPFQSFRTADGWIVVACAKEKFWTRLVEVLELAPGTPEAGGLQCEDVTGFAARRRNADTLLPVLEARFRAATSGYWLQRLRDAGVPAGPVNSIPEALGEPQVAARDMVVAVEHHRWGTVRQIASPVRVGDPRSSHRPAPRRHGDAADVLAGLGYDADRILDVARRGAFGDPPPEQDRPGAAQGRSG